MGAKVVAPKGLPVDATGAPLAYMERLVVPDGGHPNAWRAPGGSGRAPSFQRLAEQLLTRFGALPTDQNDGLALLQFLHRGNFLTVSDVFDTGTERESAN